MALSTKIKDSANEALKRLNIKVDSRTADQAELKRLLWLRDRDYFKQPSFPVLPQFVECDPIPLLKSLPLYKERFNSFNDSDQNDVKYSFQNDYFTSPDAEILYALVRRYCPKRIVEVGSGNSTKLFRQAILDGKLNCTLVSIDPNPRCEVAALSDIVIRDPVELVDMGHVLNLEENDFLFIDSSHEIKPGNDVVFLFLTILNKLKKGVIVHVHDIFLPYDYPDEWTIALRRVWGEQYLLHALLSGNQRYEVLWPGYFLQRTFEGLRSYFPAWRDDISKSVWLRVRA